MVHVGYGYPLDVLRFRGLQSSLDRNRSEGHFLKVCVENTHRRSFPRSSVGMQTVPLRGTDLAKLSEPIFIPYGRGEAA